MRKILFGLLSLCIVQYTTAQVIIKRPPPVKRPLSSNRTGKDSLVTPTLDSTVNDIKDNMLDNIPSISLSDNDLADASTQNISSVLTAGRDPFFSAASFNFSPARFRVRGYDNDLNITYMNGIPMDNLDNGFTPFGLWGGLNDVMRNRDLTIGLKPSTFAFGDLGSSTSIDARASKERKQTQLGYAFSNRNYDHRVSFYHGTGISKKGWAFVVAGSFRGADQGYAPGTYFNGYSYFFGVDKRVGQKMLLSLVAFGAPTENGRLAPSVKEIQEIANDKFYNPNWGYQNGKARNAHVGKTNQPVIILTQDYRFNNKTNIITAIGLSFGDRSASNLDWYNAADPRPDYYRYLPSYQTDAINREAVTQAMKNDVNLRQLNWDRFFDVNRSSKETVQNVNGIAGNSVTGLRSRYVVFDNVTNTTRINLNSVFNTQIGSHVELSAGLQYQTQMNNYYKKLTDLLGGQFFADFNQFAERDFPSNIDAAQNDLNKPNRLIRVGDTYGYNYNITINKAQTWTQAVFKYRKFDFFVAGELSNTQFWREGFMRNGLFPDNSFGKSAIYNFNNFAIKGGATYKFNGRHYLYLNAAHLTRAPFFDNVFISPRVRNDVQNKVTNETIQSIEGGYILNSPKIKGRMSGYFTRFKDQMNVITFFNDQYNNFTNYALNGIDKVHFGAELGAEIKLIRNVTVNAAAAIGRYYYNSRQTAMVTNNNSTEVIVPQETVYSENYRVGSTPQEAYTLGVQYRSPKFWFVGINANYFDQMWLEFNPVRRTQLAVDGLPKNGAQRNEILAQERLKGQATVDFFGGYSYKIPKSWGFKKNTFFVINVGISNILNNTNIVTGGFEQLRFDFDLKNANKFPPKYFYSFGLNYFASATIRF